MGNSNSTTGYSRLHGSTSDRRSNVLFLGHGNKEEEKEKLLIVKANPELTVSQSPERASINDRKSNHSRLPLAADSRRTAISPLLQSSDKSVVAHPILMEKKEVDDPTGIGRKLDDLKLRVVTLEKECRLMHSSIKKQEEVIEKMKKDNADLQKRVEEYFTLTSQVNNNHRQQQQQQQMVFGADDNSLPDLIDLATDINPKNIDLTASREFELKNPINDCLMPPPIAPAVVDPKYLPRILLHDLTGCVLVLVFLISMLVGLLL